MNKKKKLLKKQHKTSQAILAHGEELAERMNLRLFFSTGEENLLWVESIVITDIVYPEIPEKPQERFSIKRMVGTCFKKYLEKEGSDFYANSK